MDRNVTHGAPSWVEYNGKSAAARAFYQKVLGWQISDMQMGGEGGPYGVINVGGEQVGGISGMDMEHPAWVVYITVDDVDARFKTAVGAGAKVLMEPFDVPTVGRMCHIADPTGAMIAFISYSG
ncbi:MAG: VOC family protein [Hyphomicrobiaceae bacterium]|nr:VOC family protein [Hyphomicrobiaceae bacterium]